MLKKPPTNIKLKNNGVEIIRGICAIQVFLSHILCVQKSSLIENMQQSPFHFLFDGQCAVIVFFVLSGFFYYSKKELNWQIYYQKIKRKSLHIFPSYWISIIIGSIICNLYLHNDINMNQPEDTDWINNFWQSHIQLSDFVKASLILPFNNFDLINPPSWYLAIEVKMFIIMPIIIYFFNRSSWLLAYTLIMFNIFFEIPFITSIGSFTLGAITNKLIEQHAEIKLSKTKAIIIILISIFILNINNEIKFPVQEITKNQINLFQSIGASLLIFVFYTSKINAKKWYNQIFIYLGKLSYEIYIIHFILLLAMKPFIRNNVILILIVLITTIVSAQISKLPKLAY